MIFFIFIAITNGVLIGCTRTINSKLAINIGLFKASFWNHLIGFIFLTLIIFIFGSSEFKLPSDVPFYLYLGGVFGVSFVVINSYILPRLGNTKTVMLVISGQIISGVFFDFSNEAPISISISILGIFLILLGVYMINISKKQSN